MSISPEFRELGNFAGRKTMKAPEKSNFSQTCNLLSQYMKEKGTMSFGDLASLGTSAAAARDLGKSPAMDLFPQHTGFGSITEEVPLVNNSDLSSEMKQATKPKAKQMTIIYAGKVLVFDDIAEDKVKELMVLASNGVALQQLQQLQNIPSLDLNSATEERNQRPIQVHVSALPIARKASLHRFLEKRKDRVNARAPYQVTISNSSAAATTKPGETKTWLGLASQPPSTGLRL